MEETAWTGKIDDSPSNPDNWTNGVPNSSKCAVFPEDYINRCNWDISDFTISFRIESKAVDITIDDCCFFGGECYAPESLIVHVENLDRPPPGYIGVGDKDYKYTVFQQKWIKLFPDGLQAGVINIWENNDADNVYSVDNNWLLGHKPAGTEDIVIPDTTGIGKCVMDENSAADLGSFTVQANGEFEGVTFTLDVDGPVTLTGTFTRGTGTLQLGGGGVQNVTSGGNALYHVVVTGASTIYYTKDNTEIFDIDIQAGATFEVDAVSEGAALSISYSDIANAGFTSSVGSLLCQGSGANGVTLTAANPGSNYWDFAALMDVTMNYTTAHYFTRFDQGGATTINIDNCIFSNTSLTVVMLIRGTITSFTNNTFTGSALNTLAVVGCYDALALTNIEIITNGAACDISFRVGISEFVNSKFDETKVDFPSVDITGISKNHNDVAGAWNLWCSSSVNKSPITNDFTSSDNVTIFTGTLTVDEAAAHNDLTIKNGATFDVNGGITQTITNTGTITVESGGTLEWTGSAGNLITLRSDSAGVQYTLDVQTGGTLNVDFVDVQDCDASGGPKIDATNGNSVGKHQNNANWSFPRPNVHNFGFGTIASRPKRQS